MSLSNSVIKVIERAGWQVSRHTVNGTIEMHAIPLEGDADPQIARCNDGDGSEEEYRCACLLAAAVGIELDDG